MAQCSIHRQPTVQCTLLTLQNNINPVAETFFKVKIHPQQLIVVQSVSSRFSEQWTDYRNNSNLAGIIVVDQLSLTVLFQRSKNRQTTNTTCIHDWIEVLYNIEGVEISKLNFWVCSRIHVWSMSLYHMQHSNIQFSICRCFK